MTTREWRGLSIPLYAAHDTVTVARLGAASCRSVALAEPTAPQPEPCQCPRQLGSPGHCQRRAQAGAGRRGRGPFGARPPGRAPGVAGKLPLRAMLRA